MESMEELDRLADRLVETGGRQQVRMLRRLGKLLAECQDDEGTARIWDERLEQVLIRIARESESGSVRAEAVQLVGGFSESEDAASAILDVMLDPDRRVRASAASVADWFLFGRLDLCERFGTALILLLSDPAKEVRSAASMSLWSIAPECGEVRKLLLGFIRGPIPERRKALWDAMMAMDGSCQGMKREYADALLSVLMRLGDNKAYACWKAGESLGYIVRGKAGLNALIAALASPYPCGRWSAIHGLSHLKNPAAVPYLEEVARHDRSKTVRKYAHSVVEFLLGREHGPLDIKPPAERRLRGDG